MTRRSGQVAASAFLVALACSTAIAQPQTKRLALVGGMLLDGYEVPPLHHAAVVIEGDKIVAVGPASEVKIPADATIVDTSGRVMLPGLVELHAHLIILGHGEYARWDPWIAEHDLVERVMEISAKQLLMAGVTSAVDLGGTLKESRASSSRPSLDRATSSWRGRSSTGGTWRRRPGWRHAGSRSTGVRRSGRSGTTCSPTSTTGRDSPRAPAARWRRPARWKRT